MAQSIFTSSKTGNPTVGTSLWIDLGLIPTGKTEWIGYATYTSIDKAVSFNIRTNNTGQSTGTLSTTTSLDLASVRAGVTGSRDLYRKGRLHIATVVGTGVEHWWLCLTAKSATSGTCMYAINYTDY